MKRTEKERTVEDYASAVTKELRFYEPMARELDLSVDLLREAARVGVQRGIQQHRATACDRRESGCVVGSVRHFCDRIIIKACLMAASEEEMEIAEDILLRLIEES
jgi:hypothetical protein